MKNSAQNRISCKVNGKKAVLTGPTFTRLLDALRESGLSSGTKEGCGEGECGACSVMLNGKLVNSCLVPIGQVQDGDILTVEGLSKNAALHPLQEAFLKCGGAQCGICTPGMLIASYALIRKKKKLNEKEIREWLGGNICRCTGYVHIVDSVLKACSVKR